MKEEKIVKLLQKLNFKSFDNNIWIKNYNLNEIKVDIVNKKIEYDKAIKIGRNTITNFAKLENFVVLECVIRLLDKGYKCENIELEKDCGDAKDYIDILIYNKIFLLGKTLFTLTFFLCKFQVHYNFFYLTNLSNSFGNLSKFFNI